MQDGSGSSRGKATSTGSVIMRALLDGVPRSDSQDRLQDICRLPRRWTCRPTWLRGCSSRNDWPGEIALGVATPGNQTVSDLRSYD
jgi:hypothetical protein